MSPNGHNPIFAAPEPRPKFFDHFLKDIHGSLSIRIAQKRIQREYTIYFFRDRSSLKIIYKLSVALSLVDPKLSGSNCMSISTMGRKIGRLAKSVF